MTLSALEYQFKSNFLILDLKRKFLKKYFKTK